MGIFIKKEDKYIFYQKGADEIMIRNIKNKYVQDIKEHTKQLSTDGLRTLVFGYKIFDELPIDLSQEFLEQDLEFLAITAVEDNLHFRVKETIITLKEAGIKVWMLTGDKLETAVSIAITTGLKKIND